MQEFKNYNNHALSRTSTPSRYDVSNCRHKFPQCAPANLETTYLLEIGDDSRKLWMRYSCQFVWCAFALTVLHECVASETMF
jgi:hypothetical protein